MHLRSKGCLVPTEERKIPRDELYELVWSEALVTLAPKLGLSDVGLAKACRRLEVPIPWRGYWQKKEAGHKVKRTPLPRQTQRNGTPHELLIRPKRTAASNPEPDDDSPVAVQRRYEADPQRAIVVPDELVSPHPLVALTIKAMRGAKVDEYGLIAPRLGGCLDVRTSIAQADRAMRIMDALIRACEARAWPFLVERRSDPHRSDREPPKYCTVVVVHGQRIELLLQETTTRKLRPEADKIGRFGRDREYMWEPSGNLSLGADGRGVGARSSWSDGRKQRVETILNTLMVDLVVLAGALKRHQEELEARRRQWEEARRREDEAEARRRALAARDRTLDQFVAQFERAGRIRRYVEAIQSLPDIALIRDRNPSVAEWIDWCAARADEIDPVQPTLRMPSSILTPQDEDFRRGDRDDSLHTED